MTNLSLAEFRELAKRGNLIPVYADLIADAETPVSAFHKLDEGRGYSFLFESVEKHDQAARYSFVGIRPHVIFESHGTTIRITEGGAVREYETKLDPLHELDVLMQCYRYVASPALADARFAGGAVGFLTYDMVRFFEPTVPPPPPDDLGMPDTLFHITDTVLIFDHRTRRLRIVVNALVENDAEGAFKRTSNRIGEIVERLYKTTTLPMLA